MTLAASVYRSGAAHSCACTDYFNLGKLPSELTNLENKHVRSR